MSQSRLTILILLSALMLRCGPGDEGSAGGDAQGADAVATTGSLGTQASVTETIPALEGGELRLETAAGDHVTLSIPAAAMAEDTAITMTWLADAPDTNLMGLAYALRFEPAGLDFIEPALLTIEHAEAFDAADEMALFWIATPEQALFVTNEASESSTIAYLPHFSDYGGAKASDNLDGICGLETNHYDAAQTKPSQSLVARRASSLRYR